MSVFAGQLLSIIHIKERITTLKHNSIFIVFLNITIWATCFHSLSRHPQALNM